MCCGDNGGNAIDLKSVKYDDIKIKVDKSTLKFFENSNYGTFRVLPGGSNLSGGQNEFYRDQIEVKEKKIEELKEKISSIDEKLEAMNKIIDIDITEQEYIINLGAKIKAQSVLNNNSNIQLS